jgi:hypothetical protein
MCFLFCYLSFTCSQTQWGCRLCVHHRDFTPGKHIVDNIWDCVSVSQRVLILLSPSFARSQWCQFELRLCQTCVMERDDVIVLVVLRPTPSRDLSGAMHALMRTTTYLEWPHHRHHHHGPNHHGPNHHEPNQDSLAGARQAFWETLRNALQDEGDDV